ncbi:AlkZ-related protein [Bianquea renquensis]|jgi:hypothetical protein|uniref:Uncharacterized protein n=1 Tax=Bianquea renquensis TaxID=2763661 RepID=A0A926DSB3_9FIRM|nr:hypothetical protein [Bianquea renquensis]MBC8542874.1 hypothetical protein [Bianquea renquensis]
MEIRTFSDFCTAVLDCGFSMGGGNSEGIYSIIPWRWDEVPPYDTPVCWHTGDPETDPWEWRIRVLEERRDIAYAKVFFRKSGYIARDWYPYFIAARRGNTSLEEEYGNGRISQYARRIYAVIEENGVVPLHAIKKLVGVEKEDKAQFERALVELQMKLYITMCGAQQKRSQAGEEYGWSSTVFCPTELFWGKEMEEEAAAITREVAIERIAEQVYRLNPQAEKKKIWKFITGM